ncbi:hypothetical protein [Cruoricaptor ignavus]|nr:hypothetical protein [Cruoricaptor ignavus]
MQKSIMMTVVINQKNAKETSEKLKRNIRKKTEKGNLKKHFGKLKRDIDPLEYQLEMRKNED